MANQRGTQVAPVPLSQAPKPPKSRKRHVRRTFVVLSLVAFVFVTVLGIGYVRLQRGPIPLNFLVGPIERSINQELNGIQVRIDQAILRQGTDWTGPRVRLANIRLVNDTGATIAQAPFAAVRLNPLPLLWGQVAPGRIELIRPRLLVFHNEDRGLTMRFSRHSSDEDQSAAPSNVNDLLAKDAELRRSTLVPDTNQIDLARTISAALADTRRHQTASYLTEFGVRDATVIFDKDGVQSVWQVPEFVVSLQHKRNKSTIAGTGLIASQSTPWTLDFKAREFEKRQRVILSLSVNGLVPDQLSQALPGVAFLETLDAPIRGHTDVILSHDGDILSAETAVQLRRDDTLENDTANTGLKQADIKFEYVRGQKRWRILPSRVRNSYVDMTVAGYITPGPNAENSDVWGIDLSANEGVLYAATADEEDMPIKNAILRGAFEPKSGYLHIDQLTAKLDDGAITTRGRISRHRGIALTGEISAMETRTFERLWPTHLSPGARTWFKERVAGGRITGGGFSVNTTTDLMQQVRAGGTIPNEAFSLIVDGEGLAITYVPGMPPLQTKFARARLSGQKFSLEVPGGFVEGADGHRVTMKSGRFDVANINADVPRGEIKLDLATDVAGATDLLSHPRAKIIPKLTGLAKRFGGKVSGQLVLKLPLIDDLKRQDVATSGTIQVEGAGAKDAIGDIDAHDGAITITLSERAVEAKGDILLNGVPAQLHWLKIDGVSDAEQPPLCIKAALDDADRDQLGIAVNHMLRGTIQADLSVNQRPDQSFAVSMQADLKNAELTLGNTLWCKPPGQAAVLQFDIKENKEGQTELQNFKIVGDQIAIEGWLVFDKNHRLVAFYFPEFSFNVITQLELSGKLTKGDIWKVNAKGATYDGRAFFRSLFSAEKLGESRIPKERQREGMDIHAEIATVVGHSQASIRNLRLDLKDRNGRLVALDAKGNLDSGAPIAARMVTTQGGIRTLLAETADAGTAFRLVGFYDSIHSGEASLRVNLDGQGAAAKTGILWTRNFILLGDPIVSEVLADAPGDVGQNTGTKRKKKRQQQKKRMRIVFDQMRVPFSVGHGQFVLHDSYVNGPELGATMRGKVDFKKETIRLGGTYVPLYGLNSALGSFPILGNILVGRRGEGVLGITFGIFGSVRRPQVTVNPMSMVAPGIFRQIFEFAPANQTVLPRADQPETRNTKSSSLPPIVVPEQISEQGWQAETSNENGGQGWYRTQTDR